MQPSKRKKVATVEVQNLVSEVYERSILNKEGEDRIYFDIDFSRSYYKDDEKVLTRIFQYKDLDKLVALVSLVKTKVSELIKTIPRKENNASITKN